MVILSGYLGVNLSESGLSGLKDLQDGDFVWLINPQQQQVEIYRLEAVLKVSHGVSKIVLPLPNPPLRKATVYTQVLFKIKSAVRNRNYTGKTHLRGLKISIFS